MNMRERERLEKIELTVVHKNCNDGLTYGKYKLGTPIYDIPHLSNFLISVGLPSKHSLKISIG